ncbi:MAG: hypothetical protein V4526_01630 [Patescibacteria group bacterium]
MIRPHPESKFLDEVNSIAIRFNFESAEIAFSEFLEWCRETRQKMGSERLRFAVLNIVGFIDVTNWTIPDGSDCQFIDLRSIALFLVQTFIADPDECDLCTEKDFESAEQVMMATVVATIFLDTLVSEQTDVLNSSLEVREFASGVH